MDQIFRYAGPPGTVALYGDPFTVPDSWSQPAAPDPDWVKKVWIAQLEANGYIPQRTPFVPVYESGQVSWPGNDGKLVSMGLNELEYPTRGTVDKLALMYAVAGKALGVLEFSTIGLGPVSSTGVRRVLQWPNGKVLEAFQLANYYTNNPQDTADSLCKLLIQRVWP